MRDIDKQLSDMERRVGVRKPRRRPPHAYLLVGFIILVALCEALGWLPDTSLSSQSAAWLVLGSACCTLAVLVMGGS